MWGYGSIPIPEKHAKQLAEQFTTAPRARISCQLIRRKNRCGAIGTKRGVLDFHFWLVDVSFADVESRFVRRIVVVVRLDVFCQVDLYGVVTFSGQFRRPFWTVWAVRFPIGVVWLFHQ